MSLKRPVFLRHTDRLCVVMVATIAAVQPAPLWVHKLGAGVHLLACDGLPKPPSGGWQIYEGDRLVRPPLARTRLELATGGAREAVVLRSALADDDRPIAVRLADQGGSTLAVGAAPSRAGAAGASIFELTDGLAPAQRLRLARFVFETCTGLFRLGGDPRFLAECRRFLGELVGQPGRLAARCEIAGRYVLYEGPAAGWLGSRPAAWLLTRQGLHRTPAPPACDRPLGAAARSPRLRLLLEADNAGAAEVLVLGEAGLAYRKLAPATGRLPDAFEWLAAPDGRRASARRYVIEALAALATDHDHARAALRELRGLLPAPSTRLAFRTGALDAGVDLVVGGADGVFVSGWLNDAQGMTEAIRVERAGRSETLPVRDLDRFAHPASDGARGAVGRRGFVLFAGERIAGPAAAPCDVALCLSSGQRLQIGEGPTRHDPGTAHQAVLAAVPRAWLTPALVARCLEPALRALAPRRPTVDQVIEIGRPPGSARATAVIAVGDDPDQLRCRYGLFAADPAMAEIELVHVLDRPERAAGAHRLLEGLAAIYGIGSRLLILSGPAPGGAALDAAAAIASAATIVVLGPGVVPERGGWLEPLRLRLAANRKCGLVGARIVHADNSICAAGGELELVGPARQIDLRLPLQGFPRDYEADWTARRTSIVPSGAFAIRRALLEAVGGFPAGYLGADWALAELCLEAHARGFEAWVVRSPTLVDLTPTVALPGLDPAREIDRRLLEARWADRLNATGGARTAADPSALLWRAA